MNEELETTDPAAVFACATSLWDRCHELGETDRHLNLSECYNGIDEFMRVVMRVGARFENWACDHVDFEQLTDVWPYILHDRFGEACVATILPTHLDLFDDHDCLMVALKLNLPIRRGSPASHGRYSQDPLR
jgi:hypothetical protein